MAFGKLYTYEVCFQRLENVSSAAAGANYRSQGNARSTAIRVVAKANNLDLELVPTQTGKDVSPEYLKINPLGRVPSFVGADGYKLTECIAIAIYGTSSIIRSSLCGCFGSITIQG